MIVHDHHTNSKRHYQANSPSWKVFVVCSLSLLKSIGVVWKERNRRRRKRFFKSLLQFNHRFHPTNKLFLLPGRPFSSIGFLYLFSFLLSVVSLILYMIPFGLFSILPCLLFLYIGYQRYCLYPFVSVVETIERTHPRHGVPLCFRTCIFKWSWSIGIVILMFNNTIGMLVPFIFILFIMYSSIFFFGRNRSLSSFKPSPFYCWCSIPCLLPLLFILNSNVLCFSLFIDLILPLLFFLLFFILFVLLSPVLWLFISM